MKTLILIATLGTLLAMAASAGERIKLRDERTGAEYGPVELISGARIDLGEKTFVVEAVKTTAAQEAFEKKLKAIVIPELIFNQAPLRDAAACFATSAAKYAPDKKDVNILIADRPGGALDQLKVSLTLHNVSLYDALRYTCEACGLLMRIDDSAVVISRNPQL